MARDNAPTGGPGKRLKKKGLTGGQITTTSIRLPDDVYERLRLASFVERRPMNEIIVETLRKTLPPAHEGQ